MADSLTAFLKSYTADHPKTLVEYAQWYGKVTEPITSAELTDCDAKGLTIKCTLQGGSTKTVVVAFKPRLSNYQPSEVQAKLLVMKADAQEGLGISKPAQLKSFHLTAQIYKSVPLVLGLTYLAFAPTTDPSPLFGPARYASQYLSHQFFLNMFRATVGFHALEALYSISLCRKRTGFVTAALYGVATFFFGFPIWVDLIKRIEKAKIDAVSKS